MDPITISLLISLATTALTAVKQQEQNNKARATADLAIKQAISDNAIDQANNDYAFIGAEMKANAERIKSERAAAKLALKKTKLEKNALLGLSVFFFLAAAFLTLRNQPSTTTSR